MSAIGPELFPTALLGLEWARPAGLLALLLPAALVLLMRRRERPRSLATGTLALWEEAGEERRARSTRTRRGLPPRARLLCAALVLGALAIAGPRDAAPPAAREWRVVVDRSPSMYLPVAPGVSATRLDDALEVGLEILNAGEGASWDRAWITPGEEPERGASPPASWSEPPRAPREAPRWERWDEPGHLWITDRVPRKPEGGASLAASGGEAAPGLVAVADGLEILWDGDRLREGEARTGELGRRVRVDDRLPAELATLAGIWAEERSLALEDRSFISVVRGDPLRLVLLGAADGGAEPVRVGRDGWALRAFHAPVGAPLEDDHGALEPWLTTSDGSLRLVSWGPGRIHVALTGIEEVAGDPAGFAVSWARLFDRAVLPPAGAVSVAERSGAGDPVRISGTPPRGRSSSSSREGVPLEAWLALGALTLAVLAWFSQRPARLG